MTVAKHSYKFILLTSSLLLLACSSFAAANDGQSYTPQAVAKQAEEFVAEQVVVPPDGQIKVTAGGIDNRVPPRYCAAPLSAKLTPNANLSRFATVEISCDVGQTWRTYVPTQIEILVPVVVSKRHLGPGDMLTERDLSIELRDISSLRGGSYRSMERIVGARVKGRISANQIVLDRDTCLVCEGEAVTIIAEQAGLRITAQGVALNDGLFGESVAVKNTRSNKSLRATVAALNEVKVN